MPLERCQVNNKQGWRAGPTGKCYLSKEKAQKQLAAIEISKHAEGAANLTEFLETIKDLPFEEQTQLTLRYNLSAKKSNTNPDIK